METIDQEINVEKLEKEKPTLLLHACCGPCSTAVLERLAEDYHISILFYNPNITDLVEYNKRRSTLERFLEERIKTYPWDEHIKILKEVYDPQKFYDTVTGLESEKEGGKRCKECFKLRLSATAVAASELGFEYFATTLTVSPHKDHKLINSIGKELGKKYEVKFLDEDFKKDNGYGRSREISIEYRLYRQDYCGCEFSKEEMLAKRQKQDEEEATEKKKKADDNRMSDDDILTVILATDDIITHG